MAKYTTTVRHICEEKGGFPESGLGQVDEIVRAAVPLIFTSQVEFFDPAYREILLRKILKHYYMREIGFETVGLWCLKMNTKLEEIAPYYTFLYQHSLKDMDLYIDTDVQTEYGGTDNKTGNLARTEEISRTKNGDDRSTSNSDSRTTRKQGGTDTTSSSTTNKNTRTPTFKTTEQSSDTPQGGLAGVSSGKYLSEAKITDNTGKEITSETSKESSKMTTDMESTDTSQANGTTTRVYNEVSADNHDIKDNSTEQLTRNFLQKVKGRSGKSPIEIFKLIRESYYNIDMEVIDEFKDLFMSVY